MTNRLVEQGHDGQVRRRQRPAQIDAHALEWAVGKHEQPKRRGIAEPGLRELQTRFESAFTDAAIGMSVVDMDDRWLQVNDALCRITGYTRAEFEATTLQAITHPQDVDRDIDSVRALRAGRIANFQTEKRYRHAEGHYFWALLTVSLVRDDRGQPRYLVSQVQDVSERRRLADRLEYLIDHDYLTGLYNRQRFERELSREVERVARYGSKCAVLMIDLDNFKEVNDGLGHKAGDELLKSVASALSHRVRQTDVLARMGGDEFAVLLPEADAQQAQRVADSVVEAVRCLASGRSAPSIRTTVSVGVVSFDGLSGAEALELADFAMYEAKRAGGNRVTLYEPNGRTARLGWPRPSGRGDT